MRRFYSVAGAVLLVASLLVMPADAQMMQANGSCGKMAGQYGIYGVNADDYPGGGDGVPALYYQINYSGVPAPTTVGVIVRFNGELEDQRGLTSFTADRSSGTFTGALLANISPEAQGGGPTRFNAKSNTISNRGHGRQGGTAGTSSVGSIQEGEYVFYVYTGEIKDMPETVKDGPSGRRFFADEKGYLGTFSCSVVHEGA
jgi:hypothetical protein